MTFRFNDLTDGELEALKWILVGSDLSPAHVRTMLRNPGAAKAALAKFVREPFFELIDGVYASPGSQVAAIHSRFCPAYFSVAEIEAAHKAVPKWPTDPRQALVLVPYFKDPLSTCQMLTDFVASRLKLKTAHLDMKDVDVGYVLGNAHPRRMLRWEVIEFSAPEGGTLMDRFAPQGLPHAGVLAAFALHTTLHHRLRHEGAQGVWIPGYLATGRRQEQAFRLLLTDDHPATRQVFKDDSDMSLSLMPTDLKVTHDVFPRLVSP